MRPYHDAGLGHGLWTFHCRVALAGFRQKEVAHAEMQQGLEQAITMFSRPNEAFKVGAVAHRGETMLRSPLTLQHSPAQ